MIQQKGFVKNGKEEHVLKLKSALYRLKQVPRAWNAELNDILTSIGLVKSKNNQGVYLLSSYHDKATV